MNTHLHLLWLLILGLVMLSPATAQELVKPNFKVGEQVSYEVSYGFLDVADAVAEIREVPGQPNQFHFYGFAETKGFASWVFSLYDVYQSYYDIENTRPVRFIRDIKEGDYELYREINFDYDSLQAVVHEKNEISKHEIQSGVQDMISSIYYARLFDRKNVKHGDTLVVPMFLDQKHYDIKITVDRIEYIQTDVGKIRCIKLIPLLQQGRVFKKVDDLAMWISDDENKIPVLMKGDVFIGSVSVRLTGYKNLPAPLALVN